MENNWKTRVSVEEVFNLLKNRGLINKKREISRTRLSDFKASFFCKRILYPHSIKDVQKDKGLFILLHEEGHCINFSIQKLSIILSFILGVLVGLYSYSTGISLFHSSLFALLSFFILEYISLPLMKKEEYNCDKFATEKIRKNFPDLKPSKIFESIFFSKQKTRFKLSSFQKVINKVSLIFPYHPKKEDRLNQIKEIENES